jgi:methylthioribose-1-phosphate isomerase
MRDRLLAAEKVKAIDWRDGALHLLDQRILPFEETWIAYTSAAGVAEAIRSMVVRGAPAIGISAAYGLVLAAARGLPRAGTGRRRWKRISLCWPIPGRPLSICSGR